MIFAIKKFNDFEWHEHFCWLPTRINDNEIIWLMTITRRMFMACDGGCGYEYKWVKKNYE